MSKLIINKREREEEEVTSNRKLDITKLEIKDIIKYIGLQCENISSDFNVLRINSLVNYNIPKKLPKLKPSRRNTIDIQDRGRLFPGEGGRRGEEVPINTIEGSTRLEDNRIGIQRIDDPTDVVTNLDLDIETINSPDLLLTDEDEVLDREFLINLSDQELNIRYRLLSDTYRRLISSNISSISNTLSISRVNDEREVINSIIEQRVRNRTRERFNIIDPIRWVDSFSKTYIEEEPKKKSELTFEERRINSFSIFKNSYGGFPAIVKGYVIEGKIISSNDELSKCSLENRNLFTKSSRILIRYFYLNNNIVKSKLINLPLYNNYILTSTKRDCYYILPYIIKLKIKNGLLSNEVFSDSNSRNSFIKLLELEYIDEWFIDSSNPKKIGTSTQCIITVDNNKKIKFLPQDCIFINQELCGYIQPIDKTITSRSIVKINPNSIHRYPIQDKDETAKVISIKANKSSKKISSNSKNHRMDIVTIKTMNTGNILLVYAQDLKLIKTITKDEQSEHQITKKETNLKNPYQFITTDSWERTIRSFLESNQFTEDTLR